MSVGDNIIQTVTVLGDAAVIAAPIVGVYNPAAGAALQIFAPLVENFILSETQIVMNLKKDTSKEDMIKLLQASMSANWNIKPLETSEDVVAPDVSNQFIPKPEETEPAK
jgi:hypothetical protein